MANQLRPSPLSFDSGGRQSPFRRQNSQSPATARASMPTQSPTKVSTSLSPTKPDSLSPVKSSPFVRRPSQISSNGSGAERPTSPFARPTSGLSIPASPSRQASNASSRSKSEDAPPPESPGRPRSKTPSPPVEEKDEPARSPSRPLPSTSHLDGATESPRATAPPPAFPSQANLRPSAHRTNTSSTTSTIKQPSFAPAAAPQPTTRPASSAPKPAGAFPTSTAGTYNHIPSALLRSMRESFEVLDTHNAGAITSASVTSALDQVGLESTGNTNLTSFFPPHAPSSLNLAKYLEILSAPLAELSSNEELEAAFEAFDRDDSGQIDVGELRRALLMTGPDVGEEDLRMDEQDVDAILGEFRGRRAFGGRGGGGGKFGGGGGPKGEVFRWKQFMGAVQGVGVGEQGQEGVAV